MNLPVGAAKESGVKLVKESFFQKLKELMNQDFTGYLVLTIEGYKGMEEAIFFFKKSAFVGSMYEYNNYSETLYGEESLKHIFNAAAAEQGVFDIYNLTSQQLDLITAFNEKILFKETIKQDKLDSYKVNSFEIVHAKRVLDKKVSSNESKMDILKKFGLGKIG